MARVLIVDDERPVLRTLAEFVKEDSHEVLTAEDAAHAMSLIKEHDPDVVVVDIVLPHVSGSTLLGRIREEAPNAQVIMITGEPTVETAAAAVRDGAFDYLSKPITRDAIRTAVASAARMRALHDERERLEAENERYREHLEEEVTHKTEALQHSEARYRAVFENAVEAIVIIADGTVRFANPSTETLTGYTVHELTSSENPLDEFIHPDDRRLLQEAYEQGKTPGRVSKEIEFRMTRKEGGVRWVEIRPISFDWDGQPAVLVFARDITERRIAEKAERLRTEHNQRANEAVLRLATEGIQYDTNREDALRRIAEVAAEVLNVEATGIWMVDENEVLANVCLFHQNGTPPFHPGRYPLADHPILHDALLNSRVLPIADVEADERIAELDVDLLVRTGIRSILGAPIFSGGRLVGNVVFYQVGEPHAWSHEDEEFAATIANLTALTIESVERRAAQTALERSESEYRSLFEKSPAALWHEDLSLVRERIDELKDRGVSDLQTYLEEHPEDLEELISLVRVVDVNEAACALHHADDKSQLTIGLGPVINEQTRTSLIRQMATIASEEMQFDDICVDQTLDGEPIHVWLRWSVVSGHEETLDRVLVSKIDITRRLRAEEELRRALDGTIEAIGLTTETRDPYTAGHQRNVTELAVAIAKEMACDPAMIDGVRAAGLMHDIGKMAIPAEILSKPSRLTETELALIQMHPQVAYDILKKVAFPWPVAEIVRQHHERLDGNGYPLGLSRDEIRLEARILSVADVVEAIASHRPYRAALGIDVALAEIEQGRGTAYDARAVDACLRLFREKQFAFSNHHPV